MVNQLQFSFFSSSATADFLPDFWMKLSVLYIFFTSKQNAELLRVYDTRAFHPGFSPETLGLVTQAVRQKRYIRTMKWFSLRYYTKIIHQGALIKVFHPYVLD